MKTCVQKMVKNNSTEEYDSERWPTQGDRKTKQNSKYFLKSGFYSCSSKLSLKFQWFSHNHLWKWDMGYCIRKKKKKVLKVTPLDFRNFLKYMYVHIGCSCCCRTMFQSGTPMTKAPLLGLDSGSSILHRHTQTWMQVLVSCLFFRNTDAKLNQKQR